MSQSTAGLASSPAAAGSSPHRKADAADLRHRSSRLRDLSRDLAVRSKECRKRMQEAIALAASNEAAAEPAEPTEHFERLLKAESDLENAITECTVALDQVRRELGWRGERPSTTVH